MEHSIRPDAGMFKPPRRSDVGTSEVDTPPRRGVERGPGANGPFRKSLSEVALGADLKQDGVLILDDRARTASDRSVRTPKSRHLLVEVAHWTSPEERQVLDRVQRVTTPSCATLKSGYRCRHPQPDPDG